jgi:hypothetical protein
MAKIRIVFENGDPEQTIEFDPRKAGCPDRFSMSCSDIISISNMRAVGTAPVLPAT